MQKKKVLLIYTNVRLRNQKPRPPLGLMYLAAALRPRYTPVLLDMRVESEYEKILKDTLEECVYVGISTIIGQQLNFSMEAAKLVRRLSPKTPIVFGGTFPTMAPEVILKESCVDIVSLGDGEDTLVELADVLNSDQDLSRVENIAYRGKDGICIQRGRCLRKLDSPVMPAWDLVDIQNYREVNVLTSKGCSVGCDFCYNKIFNQNQIRQRDVGHVWEEISFLHEQHGVHHIAFVDDNFFENKQHARKIMEKFRNSGWNMTWETTCRADDMAHFDDEYLQLIRDSGCKELFIGFESASDRVLKDVHKRIEQSQMLVCMERARKYGWIVRALFVVGLPGEKRKELMQTLDTVDFLREKYPDCVKVPVFGIYTPYPQLPPNLSKTGGTYVEPQTVEEWAEYHHDRANHQWLTLSQRAFLENVIWVYRYVSKRSKYVHENRLIDRLLYYDAFLRWKWRIFSCAPEWGYVRKQERHTYCKALDAIRKDYGNIT